MTNDEIIEAASKSGMDVSGQDIGAIRMRQLFQRFAEIIEERTLERAAQRAESYAYMSQNFVALAEELRSMKCKTL